MNSTLITPRKAVFKIITGVVRRNRSLDEALDLELKNAKLDSRDRAFVRMLATTTFRRLGQIDDIVGRYLEHSLPKRAEDVEDILRMGTAQIVFLKTPPHAGVDTSVKLADDLGFSKYKGLINAVLRKISKDGDAILEKQDEARLNTPEWLWHGWQLFYGKDICYEIAKANLCEPHIDITVKSNPEGWAEKLKGQVLPTGTVRLSNSGLITELEGFETGDWWVQDVSASLPVKMLGNINGLTVADLCAAPGGKTAQLITAGAKVTAIDRSDNRMKRLKSNLQRLKLDCDVVVEDILRWYTKNFENKPNGKLFDAILLDAPCSSTGTIRRNPDIAVLKTSKDVAKVNDLQIRLLKTAFKMVKPGGTIIYSVCSLEREEGEYCVEKALKDEKDILLKPIKQGEFKEIDSINEKNLITKEGYLRTLPFYLGGIDGFFVARFTRKV